MAISHLQNFATVPLPVSVRSDQVVTLKVGFGRSLNLLYRDWGVEAVKAPPETSNLRRERKATHG